MARYRSSEEILRDLQQRKQNAMRTTELMRNQQLANNSLLSKTNELNKGYQTIRNGYNKASNFGNSVSNFGNDVSNFGNNITKLTGLPINNLSNAGKGLTSVNKFIGNVGSKVNDIGLKTSSIGSDIQNSLNNTLKPVNNVANSSFVKGLDKVSGNIGTGMNLISGGKKLSEGDTVGGLLDVGSAGTTIANQVGQNVAKEGAKSAIGAIGQEVGKQVLTQGAEKVGEAALGTIGQEVAKQVGTTALNGLSTGIGTSVGTGVGTGIGTGVGTGATTAGTTAAAGVGASGASAFLSALGPIGAILGIGSILWNLIDGKRKQDEAVQKQAKSLSEDRAKQNLDSSIQNVAAVNEASRAENDAYMKQNEQQRQSEREARMQPIEQSVEQAYNPSPEELPFAENPIMTQIKNSVDPYNTRLTPTEENDFQDWMRINKNLGVIHPDDNGEDYDFRGAFKAGLTPSENGHWQDTFKKPNHKTFSNESQYATGINENKAGHWEGDTFVPANNIQGENDMNVNDLTNLLINKKVQGAGLQMPNVPAVQQMPDATSTTPVATDSQSSIIGDLVSAMTGGVPQQQTQPIMQGAVQQSVPQPDAPSIPQSNIPSAPQPTPQPVAQPTPQVVEQPVDADGLSYDVMRASIPSPEINVAQDTSGIDTRDVLTPVQNPEAFKREQLVNTLLQSQPIQTRFQKTLGNISNGVRDFAGGFDDNYNNSITEGDLGQNNAKSGMARAGEFIGSASRIAGNPLVQGLTAALLSKKAGVGPYQQLINGYNIANARSNTINNQNILKANGYDSNIGSLGAIDNKDMGSIINADYKRDAIETRRELNDIKRLIAENQGTHWNKQDENETIKTTGEVEYKKGKLKNETADTKSKVERRNVQNVNDTKKVVIADKNATNSANNSLKKLSDVEKAYIKDLQNASNKGNPSDRELAKIQLAKFYKKRGIAVSAVSANPQPKKQTKVSGSPVGFKLREM